MKLVYCILLFLFSNLSGLEPTSGKLRTLYNSLDPSSISQHLALYELYPQSLEGQQALRNAYELLTVRSPTKLDVVVLPRPLLSSLNALIGLINKQPDTPTIELSASEIEVIDKLSCWLPNRQLPGYHATNEAQVLKLESSQIDLARGVLLSQLGNDPDAMRKIRTYESTIDLMALQVLTRVSMSDSPQNKIRAINHFIFEEMGFRFPPHSTYVKDIDLYTFLPSVLDSRRGVCLGVSILYICLAQRLNLELEIVTPPGHIFVRWHDGDKSINIETTARGVDLPDEVYLGIDTRKLYKRNIKETIGFAHFNQSGTFLERKEYDKAMNSYKKAREYTGEDAQVLSFLGYTAALKGDDQLARHLLGQVVDHLSDDAVSKETIPEDYLNGNVSGEGIGAIFMHVDKTRESLLTKKERLEKILESYPRFREGLFSLAGTWLQLHRSDAALRTLERYHQIDPNNATVEYYLAALYTERLDYNNAWKHLKIAEQLVAMRQHDPEALIELRQELKQCCPE